MRLSVQTIVASESIASTPFQAGRLPKLDYANIGHYSVFSSSRPQMSSPYPKAPENPPWKRSFKNISPVSDGNRNLVNSQANMRHRNLKYRRSPSERDCW